MDNGRKRLSWEETALRLAFDIANYRSQDCYVQVGAVAVKHNKELVLGYNGPPSGVEVDWSDRNERRKRMLHAEYNALASIRPGEVEFLAVTALPCCECIKIIAHKKIPKVIFRDLLVGYDDKLTRRLATEFGIELKQLNIET